MRLLNDDSVLPDDWFRMTVGEACCIRDDLRLPLSVEERKEMQGEFPYYGPTGVLDYLNEYRVQGRYALIGEDGDHFLKYSSWPMTQLVEGKFNVNNHAHLIEGTEFCTTEWFFYFFHHVELKPILSLQGVARYKLRGALEKLPIAIPPRSEQQSITSMLSAWDRAIEQTTALLAAKEQLKRALMQKLFDATVRLRGFRDDWQSRHLGEVFEERREPGVENLPTLSVTLAEGVIPRDDIDKPVRSSLGHADHRLVRAGDIAYNMMRMWQGGCGIVAEDGLISPAYVACKPTKDIFSRFAHHLFHSPRMIYLFWAYSYGLTDDRRRLYYEEFARIPVLLPPLKEQKKIAAVIDTVDMEIAQLKQNRDALKKQKRGLMQQLLTGKIRVSDKLLKQGAKS